MKYDLIKANNFNRSDSHFALFYIALMMFAQEFIMLILMLTPVFGQIALENIYITQTIIQLIYYLPLLVYIAMRGVNVRPALGLRKFKFTQLLFTILMSIAGYITAVGIVFLTQAAITSIGGIQLPSMFEDQLGTTPFWLVVVCISILPAIFEEISFRGVFLGGYLGKSPAKAILLSALFFALIHGTPVQLPNTFFLGVVMAIIYVYTGSLWLTMIYHMLHNTYAMSGVLDTYILNLPETLGHKDNTGIFAWGVILVCAVLVVAGLIMITRKKPPKIAEQESLGEVMSLPLRNNTQAVYAVAIVFISIRFLLGVVGTFLYNLIS